jgi:hypothetical protein
MNALTLRIYLRMLDRNLIKEVKMNKRKCEKAEDFVRWKSDDGLLEVVGIHGRTGKKNNIAMFKVICHKCKEDKELFPDGYFVSNKNNLIKGAKPCGCAKNTHWNKEQYLVLASRAAKDRFIVHGFAEEFHGAKTKLNLECLIDGHKWTASIDNIINIGNGCPKCKCELSSISKRTDEQEALDKCKEICETEYYEPIGFVNGYKSNKSRFEYRCAVHGKQNVSYNNFVNKGRRCKGCWKERQKEIIRENGNGNGYYPERKDEQDFLYVLDFNGKFIKVGRSFDVDERMKSLRSLSKISIKKIYKIRVFTSTHKKIYDTEQELHSELRERNFQYYVKWSKECFENESLFILNKLLDNCGLKEVIL